MPANATQVCAGGQSELVDQDGRQIRRCRHRERRRGEVAENRRQAAQEPGVKAHDDGNECRDGDGGVEEVHR
jgi:hypothetical protein